MRVPDERIVVRDAVRLRAWEWAGDAPATLLLHGIANYGRYWDLFADAIAGRLRLLAPDARGHGASARPDAGYEPTEFVADALAILDACAIDRALVVGHSMGGSHAIDLAGSHPDRVLGLVAVDVGPEPLREGAERARRLSLDRPERFDTRADAEVYLRQTSPGYSDAVYANRLAWLFREDDSTFVWQSSSNALRRIMERRRSAADGWRAWDALRCPVVVVRGTRSNVLSPETAGRMARAHAGARLVELDAGHNVALDRPLELADAVVDFARSLSRRRVL